MTPSYIQTIESLASQFPNRDLTLYFPDFDAEVPADCLNQTFGAPVGVAADNWPIFRDLPALLEETGEDTDGDLRMEHIFTIDLRQLPTLRAPIGARAMQLYISNAGYNEASTPGTPETRVVFLSDADVAAGPFAGAIPARSQEYGSRRFTLVPIAVPSEVFGTVDRESPLGALRTAIYRAPARLGGDPIWLQADPDDSDDDDGDDGDDSDGDDGDDGDDSDGDDAKPARPLGMSGVGGGFYLQFDEAFAGLNLGDCGIMYVFGDDAHWQCH
jgi:hypothetical protein